MDAVVAVLSRNWPDPVNDAERQEGARLIKSFVRNFPSLAKTLKFEDGTRQYHGKIAQAVAIPASSDLVSLMIAFAARVGLALYRSQYGEPAPANSVIFASWHPNAHLDNDALIEELINAMGAVKTINQGQWHVAEQFRYWGASAIDAPDQFACFAAFRQSFGILAAVRPSGDDDNDGVAFRPGFLKGYGRTFREA